MVRIIFLVVVAANAFLNVIAEPTECDEGVEQQLNDGNAVLTGKLLYEALKTNKANTNLIMSSFSIMTPFAELALYAEGNTLKELLETLNLPDKFHIRCVFPKMTNQNSNDQVTLSIANKIFAMDDSKGLTEEFLGDTKQVFHSEAETVNFNDKEVTVRKINEWVKNVTHNRIKNIATPEMFDELTRLTLVNAIYFLGNFSKKFNPKNTHDQNFHIEKNKNVLIPTMKLHDEFKYSDNTKLDCKVLEMLYKDEDFSFVVFLPNKVDGLLEMVEKLQNKHEFYNAYHNTDVKHVDLSLPKMKIESDYNLIPFMKSAGVVDIFTEDSNLTGILKNPRDQLYVTHAKQKAFIEVNERGTEAAAATIVVGKLLFMSAPKPVKFVEFHADHPFAFYILHKNNILFSGAFVKP